MLGFGYKGPLCACPAKFAVPVIPALPGLAIPPFPQLNALLALAPAMAAASAASNFNLALLANVRLPALPIPALHLGSLSTMLPTLMLAKKLGLNLTAPNASATLALALRGLANMPIPALPPLPLPLLSLNATLTGLQTLKMMLGINLLAPNIAPKLQLAINAALALPPLPFDPAPVAQMSMLVQLCAGLGISITTPGALANLALNVHAMANLTLPPLPNLAGLLNLLALLLVLQNIQSFFKIDLHLPGAALQINAALGPLLQLPALKIGAAAASGWSMWAQLLPALTVGLPALGRLDFAPLLNLPALPNLGPLTAALSLAVNANLGIKPACPICPLLAA